MGCNGSKQAVAEPQQNAGATAKGKVADGKEKRSTPTILENAPDGEASPAWGMHVCSNFMQCDWMQRTETLCLHFPRKCKCKCNFACPLLRAAKVP